MLVQPSPAPLKSPYQDYYDSHYIASVSFDGENMIIEGGIRDLNKAKAKTNFCYVKDIEHGKEVLLTLVDNTWVRVPG